MNVHAGASAHVTGENAPLTIDEHTANKFWWQKLSQSINLAGAWLFLQVLFVRLSPRIPMASPHAGAWICGTIYVLYAHALVCGMPLLVHPRRQWPVTGAGQ